MVLCDRRYSRPATLSKLPTWIKDRTSTHATFGPAFAALRKVRREYTDTDVSTLKPLYCDYNLFACCLCVLLSPVLPGEEAEAAVVSLILTFAQVFSSTRPELGRTSGKPTAKKLNVWMRSVATALLCCFMFTFLNILKPSEFKPQPGRQFFCFQYIILALFHISTSISSLLLVFCFDWLTSLV